jgi:hypothetical protein
VHFVSINQSIAVTNNVPHKTFLVVTAATDVIAARFKLTAGNRVIIENIDTKLSIKHSCASNSNSINTSTKDVHGYLNESCVSL